MELLVVMGIIVVITGVVLANNTRFGGAVLLENFAYDVALSMRKAQIYGISVRRTGTDFLGGHGIHFDLADPTHYSLFADSSKNGLYDEGESVPAEMTISQGYSISDLCATPPGGSETCDGISKLNILFKRPEPDAWISSTDESCISPPNACKESARIVLRSPRGDTKSVVVWANGQISVQQTITSP